MQALEVERGRCKEMKEMRVEAMTRHQHHRPQRRTQDKREHLKGRYRIRYLQEFQRTKDLPRYRESQLHRQQPEEYSQIEEERREAPMIQCTPMTQEVQIQIMQIWPWSVRTRISVDVAVRNSARGVRCSSTSGKNDTR